MTAAWLTGNVLAFDLETTGPEPETARIVTAHAVECGPDGARVRGNWLVNPGCPIPAEATEIHHITDEMAARGTPHSTACVEIANVLMGAWQRGLPVVIMNASFDLTVLNAGLIPLDRWLPGSVPPVLDPRVIDLGCDVYRKGKRKLLDLAAHYKVKTGAAHDAGADALMAARIVWAQARRYPLIADLTLAQMQEWQAEAHRNWANHLTEYFINTGKSEVVDPSWPLRSPRAPEVYDYDESPRDHGYEGDAC